MDKGQRTLFETMEEVEAPERSEVVVMGSCEPRVFSRLLNH